MSARNLTYIASIITTWSLDKFYVKSFHETGTRTRNAATRRVVTHPNLYVGGAVLIERVTRILE